MAKEITTTGNKKVSTLQKEFNAKFPYLRLLICPDTEKANVALGKSISGVDNTKTLSEVRTKKGVGEISLSGNKTVENLEKEFEKIFGLYVQVCYTASDGKGYYTNDDKKSLTAFNKEIAAAGGKKDIWA